MTTTISRSRTWIVLLVGALVAPATLPAQADSVRTHVVQRGETLWSLATTYLGNGQRWREIVSLNQDLFRTAEELPVGATIRIPARGSTGRAAVPAQPPASRPATPPPATPPAATPPAATPPAATPPRATADSTRQAPTTQPVSPPQAAPPPAPPAAAPERTIFFGAKPGGGFILPADSSGMVAPPADSSVVAPSLFESLSAPYVIDAGVLASAGRCLALNGSAGGSIAGATTGGALLHATATITPPAGVARPGDRFVMVRPGPVLPGLGRVVIPTGVVRVTEGSGPIRAEVTAQFEVLSCDDLVVVPTVSEIPIDVTPVPVTGGAGGRVAWVGGDALLPALAHAIIVDIGAAAGVKPGDHITIFSTGQSQEVAGAIVVRVDGLTASALITRRPSAVVMVGLPARLTGRLP